jgi:thermolysin
MIFSLVIPGLATQTQTPRRAAGQLKGKGAIINSFRARRGAGKDSLPGQDQAPPAWASRALARSLMHLEGQKEKFGLRDVAANLRLLAADQDDLGQTHMRLEQMHNGVEVFGGQLVSHLEGETVKEVGGRTFDVSDLDTTPTLSEEQAVEAARAAHKFEGALANEPEVKLVILPHSTFDYQATDAASLTWRVTLRIEDGTDKSGLFYYFINARDGSVVWRQDGSESGAGQSLYSGAVPVPSFWFGRYHMTDIPHGNSKVFDLNNAASGDGDHLTDDDDNWGDGTTNNRQSAAVDAQYGVAKTWDYFLNVFGRSGMDGRGTAVTSKVHWGMNTNNAQRNGADGHLYFGDGDGMNTSAWVSLDTVGHEFTHGVTYATANLTYQNESGAINESFSDIFGTAVEFYANSNPDYLIFEDIFIPGGTLDVRRSLRRPTDFGDPDHYSNRYTGANDNGGVHTNSGIMNNAFYLLAEGGTNSTSNLAVTAIGRRNAEVIFYRALTFYLFPSAKFYDARVATVNAAVDLFGPDSREHRATEMAWEAVGVSAPHLLFYNAQNGDGALVQVTPGGALNQLTGYPGAFSTGWTDIVPIRNYQFFYNWRSGLYAVTKTDQNGGIVTLNNGYLPAYLTKVVSTDTHILFYSGYNRSGLIGTVNASSGQFFVTQSFGPGAFSPWSHIVDTQYGMFFYNRNDGTVAVCHVQPNGLLNQTDGKYYYLPAGYDQVVVQGNDILLYNETTGGYALGVVAGDGKFSRVTLTSCAPTLAAGYRKIVAVGEKIFFYNPDTGAAAVGSMQGSDLFVPRPGSDCRKQLRIMTTYGAGSFGLGWTHLVATANGLLFYNWNNRAGAVGRFTSGGSFIQTAGYGPGAFGFWTHIVTTEK